MNMSSAGKFRKSLRWASIAVCAGPLLVGLSAAWAQQDSATRAIQSAASPVAPPIPRFPIHAFRIEGAREIGSEVLQAAVAPFTGDARDFGDVQQAIEAIEAVYRGAGFASVAVLLPEQVLESGTVKIRVVEARIGQISVTGNRHFDSANIRASLPGLTEGSVPRVHELSASLRVANENPAKKLSLQLVPAQREDVVDATIKVDDDRPLKFGLTLDNTGTSHSKALRLGASVTHANLFNRDHQATFQYQTAPEDPSRVKVYAASYRVPLYGWGDTFDIYAAHSDVDAGSIAAGPFLLAITGRGTSIGSRYSFKLKRYGDLDHELMLGIDAKRFENAVMLGSADLGNELDIHPITVQYSARLSRPGREMGGSISLVRNLPGGRFGDQQAFDLVRSGAKDSYSVLRAAFNYSRALPQDWQTRAALSLQYADTPLVPGEQFGIGGATSVRGFDEREVANDKGVQGTLELYTPELCARLAANMQCRVVAFFDWGSAYRIKPLAGEIPREHISSTGIGLRWTLAKDIAVQADYANVLQPGGLRESGDWRFHGRLGMFF